MFRRCVSCDFGANDITIVSECYRPLCTPLCAVQYLTVDAKEHLKKFIRDIVIFGIACLHVLIVYVNKNNVNTICNARTPR